MKILLLGASGLVGRELVTFFEYNNIEYIGTYFNNNKILSAIGESKMKYLDIKNNSTLENLINTYQPTICINCIVQRDVDICQNQWETIKCINIDFIGDLIKLCLKNSITLIHLSTEYVFDGTKSEYYPKDTPNPLQNYGISKLISELRIINTLTKYIIIRLPTLYTDKMDNFLDSVITTIGKKVINRIENFIENDYYIRRPLFVYDLCQFIYDIILNNDKYNGIYHFYNPNDRATKYQIANIIADYLNKDMTNICKLEQTKLEMQTDRPYDVKLLDNQYDINKYNLTLLTKGLQKCFHKLYHPKIFDISASSNIFILFDLDGTLINSNKVHVACYNKAFKTFNLNLHISNEYYEHNTIDKFLHENINDHNLINLIVKKKLDYFHNACNKITLLDGVEELLMHIDLFNINHCVVTNTKKVSVVELKKQIPCLNKLKNWIVREDYHNPKPHPESYQKAKNMYYKNEEYIIGFENTIYGFQSLQNVTDIIYMLCNLNTYTYEKMKKEDIYIINNFKNL